MLDREGRLKVIGVAVLALAVMGGVVASALVHRNSSADEEGSAGGSPGSGSLGSVAPDRKRGLPSGCAVDPASPPVAQFELKDDVLDAGTLKQDVEVVRDVLLRNSGSGVLCAGEPVTGCGCVHAVVLGEGRIPPSTSATIRLTINTANKEGHQEKEVRVPTNDPNRLEAKFKVVLDIKQGIVVASYSTGIYFGQHAPGKPAQVVVRLKSPKKDPPWEVTSVEGQRTKFTYSVKQVEPDDPTWRNVDLTIAHPGELEPGLHTEDLKVRTTCPDRPEIVLAHTQLIVVSKYFPSPPKVSFGYVGTRAVPQPRVVHVRSAEGSTDWAATGARVEGGGFTAKPPVRVTDGWDVEVAYDEALRPAGTLEATLVLTIADPEMPVLRVPLWATVMGDPKPADARRGGG